MSPEVLIYLQQVKNYFETSNDAKEYFIGDADEELFFKHLTEIAEGNLKDNGEPLLNKEQFELLRTTIKAIHISTKSYTKEEILHDKIFLDTNFGKICLN
jgi:hypothetical protein